MAKGTGIKAGPVRGTLYARAITRFDYQPDLCKDYKETGYCGYGDSCKFLHDRGDYKSGWQLEKQWEEEQKAKRARDLALKEMEERGEVVEEEDPTLEGVPFACSICRGPFVDPVRTKCRHYYCERCILRETKCDLCGESTLGIFNRLTEVEKDRLKRARIKHLKDHPEERTEQEEEEEQRQQQP